MAPAQQLLKPFLPTKLKARMRKCMIPINRSRVAFGHIGSMSGDFNWFGNSDDSTSIILSYQPPTAVYSTKGGGVESAVQAAARDNGWWQDSGASAANYTLVDTSTNGTTWYGGTTVTSSAHGTLHFTVANDGTVTGL